MTERSVPDSRGDFATAPTDVRVTVFRVPDDGGIRRRWEANLARIPIRVQKFAVAAGVVAMVGALIGLALGVGGRGVAQQSIWGVRDPGPAGIAAAYGYPLGCLRVRIAQADPTYARADFHRRGSCAYVSGFATVLFHRFGGEWHPVLYSVSPR